MKPASLLLIAALLATQPLASQTPADDAGPQAGDPPGRVARLNWLTGDVSFQPAGLEDWTDATLNYPLTTNDHLFTGSDARVELHIGPNAIRLDSNSNFGFLNLDDSIVQASLTEGSMEIRLHFLDDNESFEVATPNGAITLLRTGDYRIDTDPDRDATMLTIRSGQAELYSGGKSVIVRANQTAYFTENQDAEIRSANEPDDFDAFVAVRESAEAAPVSDAVAPVYLSPEMTGAEDLNTYGSWETLPAYGDAWVPPVEAGWAPYSDGSWSYVNSWGWTWIDSAPWGFAPFHYGRWLYVRDHWAWIPGARTRRVVYAPALVVFFGGGSGAVSWYALGPHDQWIPPWRSSATEPLPLLKYSSNSGAPGAIRTLSQADFIAPRHVHPGVAPVAAGRLLGSSPLLAPVRDSVLSGAIRPRPPLTSRPLVVRTALPPAAVPFSSQQDLLKQNQGRPLESKQVEELRRQAPAAAVQAPAVRVARPPLSVPPPTRAQPTGARPDVPRPVAARPAAPRPAAAAPVAPARAAPQGGTQSAPAATAQPIEPRR